MPARIEDYLKRPQRYANVDGTGELSLGLMMLGFALVGYLQAVLPRTSIWMRGWTGMAFMYLILTPVLCLGYWGTKAIKKHITYPRTGYVAYPPVTRRKAALLALLVSAAVSAIVVYLVVRHAPAWHDAMIFKRSITIALLVAPYAWFVFRMGGEHRWKWIAVLFLAAGLAAISLAVTGSMIAYSRPASLFAGLVWVASGAATLYLYLRRTRAPGQETE